MKITKTLSLCIISTTSMYTMHETTEKKTLSRHKRAMIEQWVSQIPVQPLLHPAPIPDTPNSVDRSFHSAPYSEKTNVSLFKCPRPSCPLRYNTFEALREHCLHAHTIYFCMCGGYSKNKYAFDLHRLLCRKQNFNYQEFFLR